MVSSDGVILTNRHVVLNADKIRVRFADKRDLPAIIVGMDPLTDLAVLKVDAKNLPTAMQGDSSKLKVGQWVLAIGAPMGLERTATQGIISALGRALPTDNYVSFIQTDVPINPGNSGGALVNALGEVIGINTFILTGGGGSEGNIGLGFAVPVDRAARIAREIREHGRVRSFVTGISTDPLAAQAMGIGAKDGVLVSEVKLGSPGAKAGVRSGDLIVGADGHRIADLDELRQILRQFRVGDRLKLELRRGSETLTAWMILEEGKE